MEYFDSPLVSSFIHIKRARAVCIYTHTHIYIYIHTHIRAFREPEEEGAFCISLASLSLFSSLFVLCVVHRYE